MRLSHGLFAMLLLWAAPVTGQQQASRFDHVRHARLFPVCSSCHAGAATSGQSLWPEPASCSSCHDGAVRPRVNWVPPAEARRSNLRFSHAAHPETPGSCTACHAASGSPAMAVQVAVVDQCLTCHKIQAPHLSAPDAACSTCHVPLAQATRLTRDDIARFPAPPSHRVAGFGGGAHGLLARAGSASCATCHARDFCASCHVNAPEQPVIRALAPDPRSLAIGTALRAPASHQQPAFLTSHGAGARKDPAQCSTCHTRESCLSCHTATPRFAAAMPSAGVGRGMGAHVERHPPPSHTPGFREKHGSEASASPATCSACHARTQCLECHRPSAASAPRAYHPAAFLERHPSAAYARQTSCADCHNTQVFCTSCHVQSGLVARVLLGSGYHDAKRFFLLGHGQAARQGLESCVSCHAERDCVSCHSAQGGRRFNPHGPGFDADRLRKKNPEPCTVCHGTNVPGGP
jgi:hypothetical protein